MEKTKIRRNSGFVVAITQDDYIILDIRSDGANQRELPGGGFENDERFPHEATARETHEEIALTIKAEELKLVGFLFQRILTDQEGIYEQGIVFLYVIKLSQTKAELETVLHVSGKENEPIGVEYVTLSEVLDSKKEQILLGHRRMIIHAIKKSSPCHGSLGRLKDHVYYLDSMSGTHYTI